MLIICPAVQCINTWPIPGGDSLVLYYRYNRGRGPGGDSLVRYNRDRGPGGDSLVLYYRYHRDRGPGGDSLVLYHSQDCRGEADNSLVLRYE